MNARSYRKRVQIPLVGNQSLMFFTKSRLKIAIGYEKVLFKKSPVVQFGSKNVILENLYIPFHTKWKEGEGSDHIEYRSKDYCNIKLLYCKESRMYECRLLDLCLASSQATIKELIKTT